MRMTLLALALFVVSINLTVGDTLIKAFQEAISAKTAIIETVTE